MREQALLQVEVADVAFRSGLGPESDSLAARLAVAQLDDRIDAASRDVALARVRLTRWIGEAASGPLGEPPAMDSAGPHGTDVDAALLHHPGLERLERQVEIARAEAEIARANQRSDWTVELMYGQRSPDYSNMMSFRASKPLRLNTRDRQDRELAISDNLSFVDAVVAEVAEQRKVRDPLVFAGFSQGVAMAYRAACAASRPVGGVIALGGDVPPELDAARLARARAALVGRGQRDEWYSAALFAADTARLGRAGVALATIVLDAGHEWTHAFGEEAGAFLTRQTH